MERTSNHRAGPQNASYQGMEHFQQENGLLAFPFTSKAQWRRRHEHESWFLEIVDTRAIIDVHILRNSLDVGYKLGAGSVVDSWGGQGAWFCSWLQSPYVVSSLSHLPLWRSVLANFCNISATSEETHACSFISLAGCTRCLWQLVLHEVFVGLWFDYELLPSASYEYTTKIAWMQMVMGPYPNQSCRLGVQHFVAMFLWTKAHIWPDILFLDSLYFSHTILQAIAGSLFRSYLSPFVKAMSPPEAAADVSWPLCFSAATCAVITGSRALREIGPHTDQYEPFRINLSNQLTITRECPLLGPTHRPARTSKPLSPTCLPLASPSPFVSRLFPIRRPVVFNRSPPTCLADASRSSPTCLHWTLSLSCFRLKPQLNSTCFGQE